MMYGTMGASKKDIEKILHEAYLLPSVCRAREYLSSPPITTYPYHNEAHTLDVMREAAVLGLADNLSEGDLRILLIAAAWHDVGFMKSPIEHESTGAALFREHYAKERYPELPASQVETVVQMILDTKVRIICHGAGSQQFAHTFLSKYLLDADLSNLGRKDFFDCFERLIQESSASRFDFSLATLGLISRHRWNTSVAEDLRLEQEMRNAIDLVAQIKEIQ